MTESLSQALQLTAYGMGMTFAAIGALVLGMYAMTLFIKDKEEEAAAAPVSASESAPVPSEDAAFGGRRRAAAAAVAVALAQTAQAAKPAAAATGTWSAYIRGQHLSQRQQHDLRRVHP